LLLIGIVTAMGRPREAASEYVAPEQAVPRGRAMVTAVLHAADGSQLGDEFDSTNDTIHKAV
jgi:hypothetical protein